TEIMEGKQFLEQLSVLSSIESDKYLDIKKYFNANNFNQLCALKGLIDNVKNENVRNILMTAFLSIIEASSNRRKDGNGLKTVETKVENVKEFFIIKASEILEDIEALLTDDTIGEGISIADSAINLHEVYLQYIERAERKIGAIIFSPPYANSFDYFESYKLELVFGDFVQNIRGINTFREKAVRSFVGVKEQKEVEKFIDLIADEILRAIPEKEAETGKKDFRTRKVPNMIKGYFADMKSIIKQCFMSIEQGK